jgi:hypothetical protein
MKIRFSIVIDAEMDAPNDWALTRCVQEIVGSSTEKFNEVKVKHLSLHVHNVEERVWLFPLEGKQEEVSQQKKGSE